MSFFYDDDEDNYILELGNFIFELLLESFDDVGVEVDGEILDDGDDFDFDEEFFGFYIFLLIMICRRRKVNVFIGLEKDNVDGCKCILVK